MTLPAVHLTIDGHAVPMEDDWEATEAVGGGMDRMSCRVPLERIRSFSIGQESLAVLWGDDLSEPIWWGTLGQDPAVDGDIAQIDAEGPAAHMEKEAGRLLYMSRDYSRFVPKQNEPHRYPGLDDKIPLENLGGGLLFRTADGVAIGAGTGNGFVLWVPKTPGGITHVAGDITKTFVDGDWKLRTERSTGPSGTQTVVNDLSLGVVGSFSTAIASAEDALGLSLFRATNATMAEGYLLLTNLRYRGIATADAMSALAVMQDIFTRMGWSTSGLVGSGTDVMPLDWHGGSFRELAAYVSGLVELPMIGPIRPDKTGGRFEAWGANVWRLQRGAGAGFSLQKLKVYNKVVVPYTDVGGAPREVSALASPDPLAAKGITRTFITPELRDPQKDGTLATVLASTYAARLAADRWVGHIDAADARDRRGRNRIYYTRPGDHGVEEDGGPLQARTHRLHAISKHKDGATFTVEDDALVSGLEGLAALSNIEPAAQLPPHAINTSYSERGPVRSYMPPRRKTPRRKGRASKPVVGRRTRSRRRRV